MGDVFLLPRQGLRNQTQDVWLGGKPLTCWALSLTLATKVNLDLLCMCMRVLPACMHMHHVNASCPQSLEEHRVSDPLEPELWMTVSHHVGAGKRTQVLCRTESALNC